jgi:hypothetical protein
VKLPGVHLGERSVDGADERVLGTG